MAVQTMGSNFPEIVVKDIFNKVKGKSSLAKLSPQMPIAFTGSSIFTFSMDGDVALVAESGSKPHGGVTATPKIVMPLKVVYQARVSDEFMTASEEAQLDILRGYTEGFSRKLGAGLDKMAFHKINPATGSTSTLIKESFDTDVSNKVTFAAATGPDAAVEAAVALLGDNEANGIAMSKAFAALLAQETANGAKKYPQLAWGGQPETLNGLACDINSTVGTADYAIVGDYSAFRWGYAKEIDFEVIQYGDPDQSGVDLKASNQVMLRSEAYIGFAILDPGAFARVLPAASGGSSESGSSGES